MKYLPFYIPIYRYEVEDWKRKKKAILNKIQRKNFERRKYQNFYTDRQLDGKSYCLDFDNIFSDELNQFCEECKLNEYKITDIWTVKYEKQDHQIVHNHRSTGFSGILYLEYDEKFHEPTIFVGPWNDPITDNTQIYYSPNPKEGIIYIFPSFLLHYVKPNYSNKQRIIISWDMLVC